MEFYPRYQSQWIHVLLAGPLANLGKRADVVRGRGKVPEALLDQLLGRSKGKVRNFEVLHRHGGIAQLRWMRRRGNIPIQEMDDELQGGAP